MRWAGLALWLACAAAGAQEFTFDVAQYAKKPWELGGYLQLSAEHQHLDGDAALYALSFPDTDAGSAERYRGVIEVNGVYRRGMVTLNGLAHLEAADDPAGWSDDAAFYELYAAVQPRDTLSFEAGKRALRWGKGYAFSPVAFLERPKDPTDPELAREGFVLAAAEAVRSYGGALRTIAVQGVVLPVDGGLNEQFGAADDVNAAARLYLLYRDTDIDFLVRTGDSRPQAAGMDVSRNLSTNFEVHGEIAWFEDREVAVLAGDGTLARRAAQDLDLLLGLRYLTAAETTWIVEYYRNGAGRTAAEMRSFFDLARRSATDPAARAQANAARQAGYGGPQPMRDYLYLRVTQKEPFDALYWNAAITSIVSLADGSASLIPELIYTGIGDLELRGRVGLVAGGRDTDFGERQNDWRVELRARWFF